MEKFRIKGKVLNWVDQNQEEIIGFLQDLVRIPSVTPWFKEDPLFSKEIDVQKLIGNKMKLLGADLDYFEPNVTELSKYAGRPGYYPDHEFENRPNLAATIKGSGHGKSLILTGHVDVVPAATGWTVNPFSAKRENGFVYGRGTVDMKGGIAAMVMAVEAVVKSGFQLKGDVIVGTVVDEEAGGMGSLAFVDKGYRADAAIMTEPTDLRISPLCRGILWGKLVLKGRSGSIEMEKTDWRDGGAVDAIELARFYMDHFDRLNNEWSLRKNHPYLPLPCQLLIAQISAGEYPTSFANQAELIFNAQYLPEERDEFNLGGKIKKEIEEFVSKVAETDPWLCEHKPTIEWLIDADCAETPVENEFVQLCVNNINAVTNRSVVQGATAHTDMGWFVNVGIPTINFGPGDPRVCHQSDENISEQDLIDATKMIALTLIDWCGVEEG